LIARAAPPRRASTPRKTLRREENESEGTPMPDKSRKNTENAERTQMGQGGWIGVDCKDYIESEQWWGYGIYCKGRNVAKDVQPQIY